MNPGEIGFALKWKAFHRAGTDYTGKFILRAMAANF
jgi:hypothetical protein